MANPSAIEYGKTYHIFNRGNNRENIFIEERNYYLFLMMLSERITPVFDTYGYVFLQNHFHLFVKVKDNKEIPESFQNQCMAGTQCLVCSPSVCINLDTLYKSSKFFQT